ncbi:MAG: hypothetical protein ACR2LU_06845, partial [Luteitalea sp.]
MSERRRAERLQLGKKCRGVWRARRVDLEIGVQVGQRLWLVEVVEHRQERHTPALEFAAPQRVGQGVPGAPAHAAEQIRDHRSGQSEQVVA